MALEWFDGCDQYGGVAARLLDGVYAETNGVTISSANPRTGQRHFRVAAIVNDAGFRRVLTAPRASFGVGYAFSITSLPTDQDSFALLQARNAKNKAIFTVLVGPSGDLYIRNGGRGGAVIAIYPNPAVFANAYQHFELKFDDGFKLLMNEVLLIDSAIMPAGIDGGVVATSVKIGNGGYPLTGALDITWDIDDLYCYNMTGDINNDLIGDCKVYTRFGNADLPQQDFDISVGNDAYKMLDNVPPMDGSEYLSAEGRDLPKRAAFALPDLPLEIVEVKGVLVSTRMFKTDAGPAKLTAGIKSGSSEAVSPVHAISMAPVWYSDVFDRNPATSGAWSLSAVNDISVFIERIE